MLELIIVFLPGLKRISGSLKKYNMSGQSDVLSQDFSNPADVPLNINLHDYNDLSSSSSSSLPSTIPMEMVIDNSQRENPMDITTERLS